MWSSVWRLGFSYFRVFLGGGVLGVGLLERPHHSPQNPTRRRPSGPRFQILAGAHEVSGKEHLKTDATNKNYYSTKFHDRKSNDAVFLPFNSSQVRVAMTLVNAVNAVSESV